MARFVKINSEMRKANNKTLADLQYKTADHWLFSQPFTRQSHAQAESSFADVRNYMYHGQKIDQQVHLGYDLAVTQHVGVEASNDGKVVYAAPLGIYGNCIVVDHGYGLQTIYGHLSQIDVHEGDTVKRGQVMGQSGMTGMAGGDHVHFAMQLDGVQIDPKEWWDPHWIRGSHRAARGVAGIQCGGRVSSGIRTASGPQEQIATPAALAISWVVIVPPPRRTKDLLWNASKPQMPRAPSFRRLLPKGWESTNACDRISADTRRHHAARESVQCFTDPCIPASKLRRSSRGSARATLSGKSG